MSGIIALACCGQGCGQGPDLPRELERAAAALAFRGPDGVHRWHDEKVGLACAAFRTLGGGRDETTPASLDGRIWMVADLRLDDRPALRTALRATGRTVTSMASDAQLVLHAYHAWGTDAFRRIAGDFACVLWDRLAQRLIAARDPLGVKQLYHARWQGGVALSNTLQALLALPGVDHQPDSDAVADYLLFDAVRGDRKTAFAAIRQVPPAHLMCWRQAAGTPRHERYWSWQDLARGDHPDGTHPGDWLDAFRTCFEKAIADRLPAEGAAILMSGGLDSTSIAVTADELYAQQGANARLTLHTVTLAPLIAEEEERYAKLVAQQLPGHHHLHRLADARLFAEWPQLVAAPVLGDFTLEAATRGMEALIAAEARVVLTGHGGDELMTPDSGFFLRQVRSLHWLQAASYLLAAPRRNDRRLPPLGIASAWHRWRQRDRGLPALPAWLSPALVRDLDLEARWHDETARLVRREADRTRAFERAFGYGFSSLFQLTDAGARGRALEQRHPCVDLRLLSLALTMPKIPFHVEKHVLREAMRDRLPQLVRVRPKRGLSRVPPLEPDQPASAIWRKWRAEIPELARFVDPSRVLGALEADERAAGQGATVYRWENRRPLNLGLWMRGWLRPRPVRKTRGVADGGAEHDQGTWTNQAALSGSTARGVR